MHHTCCKMAVKSHQKIAKMLQMSQRQQKGTCCPVSTNTVVSVIGNATTRRYHTSPTAPTIMRTPPKKRNTAVSEAPLPPAPRHPIKMHDSGESDKRNPPRQLGVLHICQHRPRVKGRRKMRDRLTEGSDCRKFCEDHLPLDSAATNIFSRKAPERWTDCQLS